MKRRTYRNRTMQKCYDACVTSWRPEGTPGERTDLLFADGKRRTGATFRQAFWTGFDGTKPHLFARGTMNWACLMAGKDCAR